MIPVLHVLMDGAIITTAIVSVNGTVMHVTNVFQVYIDGI